METNENMVDNPQVLYEWKAPLRAYKKQSKGVMRFYIALALLLSVLIVLIGDRILILPIWASLFIFYALTVTEPPNITHKITHFGIQTEASIYPWEDLSFFYYTKRLDYYSIAIVTTRIYPSTLYLVVTDEKQLKKVVEILAQHLVFQDRPRQTITDRILQFFSSFMPQEEDQAEPSKDAEASLQPQTPSPISQHPHPTSQ